MSVRRSGPRVLVTGAGALLGQGIIKCLRSSLLDPHIIGVDPDPLAAGLYLADSAFLVPLAAEADYVPRLVDLVEREDVDVVLPGTDVELAVLAEARATFEGDLGVNVLVSPSGVVAIADDKWKTVDFLTQHGFPAPASALRGGVQDLVERVGFPLIVKPRVGARSVGLHVVGGWEELQWALTRVDDPIIQEQVGSSRHEYTAGVLTFDGVSRGSMVMRRDLRDGNTYRAYVDAFPELNRQVQAIAEALRPYGPANFQFRVEGGIAKVFEINARFSGTTVIRAMAGWNEVEAALRMILSGIEPAPPQPTSMTVVRQWTEVIVSPERYNSMTGPADKTCDV